MYFKFGFTFDEHLSFTKLFRPIVVHEGLGTPGDVNRFARHVPLLFPCREELDRPGCGPINIGHVGNDRFAKGGYERASRIALKQCHPGF